MIKSKVSIFNAVKDGIERGIATAKQSLGFYKDFGMKDLDIRLVTFTFGIEPQKQTGMIFRWLPEKNSVKVIYFAGDTVKKGYSIYCKEPEDLTEVMTSAVMKYQGDMSAEFPEEDFSITARVLGD